MIKTALLFTVCFLFLNTTNLFAEETYDMSILDDQVNRSDLKPEVMKSFGKGRRINPSYAKNRGMISTGVSPKFDEDLKGRGIDEYWAKDYRKVRGREAYHGGIDIPAPRGTPILAVASGTVVAKFMNEQNPKGIEIIIRHSPTDTNLPMWVYTQYTHLKEMPDIKIGQKIDMGQVIGKTSNTGISGREAKRRHGNSFSNKKRKDFGHDRRDALHLGAFYSKSKKYMINEKMLIPVDAYWMDPNALYKKTSPYDSVSLKALSNKEKEIPIPCMLENGEVRPKDTKVIWPYICKIK